MLESVPARAPPETVTVFPVPTFLLSNTPVADAVTVSPDNTPEDTSAATVAAVEPSYTLLLDIEYVAAIPKAVMSAVVLV